MQIKTNIYKNILVLHKCVRNSLNLHLRLDSVNLVKVSNDVYSTSLYFGYETVYGCVEIRVRRFRL